MLFFKKNFPPFFFKIGGDCQPCECNGNIDTSDLDACDRVTGICQKCLENTAGDHCERCDDWYYGDAINLKNCEGMNVCFRFITILMY